LYLWHVPMTRYGFGLNSNLCTFSNVYPVFFTVLLSSCVFGVVEMFVCTAARNAERRKLTEHLWA